MSNERIFYWSVALILGFVWLAHGYLYNNAETQAKSIKMCQSVGADWRYNDDNQVLCVRPKKGCE